MSFSFVERAPTASAAIAQATSKMDSIVEGQPLHAKDRDAIVSTVETYANLLGDAPEGKVVQLNVSGSVMTMDGETPYSFSVNIQAFHEAAAPGGI